MITKSAGGAMVVARSRRPAASPRCLAATGNPDVLRSQLDQLHAEAESTRAKANSARLRLLRLSEAAENLRRQAAKNVQTGNESEARELLFQKKKVMQALEKAKTRIELLDKLLSKLSEAISVKETQLIGSISVDLEVGREDDSGAVHIVSPKQESAEDENKNDHATKFKDDKKSEFALDSQASQLSGKNFEEFQAPLNAGTPKQEDVSTIIFTEVSSYEAFLENLDQQLSSIEAELVTIVNVSSLVVNHKEKPTNVKIKQITEILEGIHHVRERIANVSCAEAKIS